MSTPFESSCELAKSLKWTDEELGQLYGLYKQATVGDVTAERPGGLLDWTAKAKWDAWHAVKGVEKAQAEERYTTMVVKKNVRTGAEE